MPGSDLVTEVNGSPQPTLSAKFRQPWPLLWMFLTLLSAGLVIYSQTMAFVWDEGFHLVAAQLISWGETPYLDFAFPQTLLNAYFNAAVLHVFGSSWRAVHFFDALFVITTVWLAATYVMRRFPEQRWKLSCAVAVATLVGLNPVVVAFGPVAQAYGSGMLLLFVAFRVAVRAVDRPAALLSFLAGLFAGASAGATLLTAPTVPVLLVWIIIVNRAGSRSRKLLAFCVGALLPFLPEFWLLVKAPRVAFFNIVQYQALFRRVNWGDVGAHDFDIFLDWTESTQTLLLGLLAIIGLLFLARKSKWDRVLRSEFYLAAALAIVDGAYIATAHPTFGRYFVFLIPFVAVIASAGFYYVGSRLISPERPRWPVAILFVILAAGLTKYLFDDRDATHWSDYQKIAEKIKEVTPPGQEYMADEMVYFLLKQRPPKRMEFSYSHKLELPQREEDLYHMISFKELGKQIAKGRFATVESCKDEVIDDFKLNDIFPNKQDFDDCSVFWRKGKPKK